MFSIVFIALLVSTLYCSKNFILGKQINISKISDINKTGQKRILLFFRFSILRSLIDNKANIATQAKPVAKYRLKEARFKLSSPENKNKYEKSINNV